MQSDNAGSHRRKLWASFNKVQFPVTLCISVIVTLAGCSSGSSGSPNNGNSGSSGGGTQTTAPVLTGLAPPASTAGATSLTLSANGSNFGSSSQIEWNGAPLTTTYVSPLLLTAQVPASDLATVTTSQVTVFTPGAGGGTSSPQSFAVNYPQPSLTSISPISATAGSAAITLTAIGFGYVPGSQIQWNGTVLATTFISGTHLTAQIPASDLAAPASVLVSVVNPTPGGGQSVGQFFTVNPGTTQLKVVSITANDIVWDATRSRLYASQPGANGAAGDIVAIDPVTTNVTATQAAGHGPDALAISSDASYLWAGVDADSSIQRFNLPSLTPDIKIPLSLGIGDTAQPLSLRPAPNSPKTIAALLKDTSYTTPNSLIVYNDATPQMLNVASDITSIDWGADTSTLLAGRGVFANTASYSLTTVNYSPTSIKLSAYPYAFMAPFAFNLRIHFDQASGYVYADDGRVVNPSTGDIVGSFNLSALFNQYSATYCVVDSSQGIVFFLGQTSNQQHLSTGYTIQAFDKSTYRLLGSLNIPQYSGVVGDFVRWGSAGLAFNIPPSTTSTTTTSSIYLVDGSFVNSAQTADFSDGTGVSLLPSLTTMNPQIASVGAADTTITVSGANFVPGSTVFWSTPLSLIPLSLNTTYINSGQLQATIPANLLAAEGANTITVRNSITTAASLNGLTFSVGPSAFSVMNLDALNLAWDANSSLLYAGVSSADPQYPNSIVAINPTTGQVVKSQFAGSDPSFVRTSADGKYLYTGFQSNNAVAQLQIPSLSSPLTWSLGADSYYGPLLAADLQPAPGASQTTAIAVGALGQINSLSQAFTRANGNLRIFDNNVARPTDIPSATTISSPIDLFVSLQWGKDSSTLYAEDNNPPIGLYSLAVNSSGVSVQQNYPNALVDSTPTNPNVPDYDRGEDFHFDTATGYIYTDGGNVLDPTTGKLINSFNSAGLAVPDSSTNRVFILGQTQAQHSQNQFGVFGDYTIESFDKTAYTPLSSITLTGIQGTPAAMVRWDSSGLAFVTNPTRGGPNGMLYILDYSKFTNSSQTAAQPKPTLEPVYRTWSTPHLPTTNSPASNHSQSTQVPNR
jgi:hypothetical protein